MFHWQQVAAAGWDEKWRQYIVRGRYADVQLSMPSLLQPCLHNQIHTPKAASPMTEDRYVKI